MNEIKDLIWEFEQGYIDPYKLVQELKNILNENINTRKSTQDT